MAKYRSKPVEVDAWRYRYEEMPDWICDAIYCKKIRYDSNYVYLYVDTPDKWHPGMYDIVKVYEGDYIVKDEDDWLYVYKPSAFKAKYEPMDSIAKEIDNIDTSKKDKLILF